MFIQGAFQNPSPTGIQLVHPSCDKYPRIYATETVSNRPGLAIVPSHNNTQITHHYDYYHHHHHHHHHQHRRPTINKQYSPIIIGSIDSNSRFLVQSGSCVVVLDLTLRECFNSTSIIVVTVSTVRALYAGTLAPFWTTAPSLPQRPLSQLAVCLFLATLTIAARCYASSNATHHLVQFNPSSFSPIDNSAKVPHSSSLALGPHQPVQSDTSVIIVTNSKRSLRNQNSNRRIRRELRSALYNRINNSEDTVKTTRTASSIVDIKRAVPEGFPDAFITSGTADSDKVNSTDSVRIDHQNDSSFSEEDAPTSSRATERPMPPVHDHGNASSVSDLGILVLVLSAIVLTVALGLVTCVLSHYRPVAGEGAADGGTAANPHDAARTPTTAPMLSVVSAGAAAGVGGMDRLRGGRAARELAATRDRQVRLHAVHTDIAINLPPNIAMPDGEEHPFTSSRLHLRDPEQESEIHQKCIRPPPNRTVLESESPPPYRSSSAGLLGSTSTSSSSSSSGGGDWSAGGSAPLVVRCHSMSSSSTSSSMSKRPEAGSSGQKTDFLQRTVKIFTGGKKGAGGPAPPPAQTLPVIIVPTRPRRTSSDQQGAATPRSKPSV